ncbi:MAG: outer membrane lipoprotein carrier protein LolA [Deltaproteobacteria bacterium]|nr:outer membrane lipoprotein carrier protein LolA [Deltaproteobacteria bacterium]
MVAVFMVAGMLAAGPWQEASAAPAAEQACNRPLLDKVQQSYRAMQSFRSRFEQEDKRAEEGKLKAQGTIEYQKPGRMRWSYEPPHEQLLVTDGQTVWLFDPLLENVTVQRLEELTRGTPLAFLLGAGDLEKDFQCLGMERASGGGDDTVFFSLAPRSGIPGLNRILLGVSPASGAIRAFVMVDSQENRRIIRLLKLEVGVEIPAGRFTFEITPEMEVIRRDE